MTRVQVIPRTLVRTYEISLPIAIGVLALMLVFPQVQVLPVPLLVVLGAMSVLLLGISLNDFRTHRVPNGVTYPLMLAGVIRAVAMADAVFVIYWLVIFSLWQMRFMGGGDAKLLMGLFGLFPDFQFAWLMTASILVTGMPYLLFKYRRQWRTVPRALLWRLITRQLLPTQGEFESEAVPYAFSFCLAGVVYLWLRFGSV